jgi:diketogulonate reductase-like aldo/keto reductase
LIYSALGKTELKVSKLAFGTWGVGGPAEKSPAYKHFSNEDSLNLILRAIESGINFLDTSPAYGNGNAEKLIGKIPRNLQFAICTKVGRSNLTDSDCWEPKYIKRSISQSLINTNRESLDVVLLHSPNVGTFQNFDNAVETLINEKNKGKIGFLGVSLQKPSDWQHFKQYEFSVVQINFNLLDLRALKYFKEWESKGIKSNEDHRLRWPDLLVQKLLFLKNQIRINFNLNDEEFPQLALEFLNAFENIASIISTMLSQEELDFNCSVISRVGHPVISKSRLIEFISRIDQ